MAAVDAGSVAWWREPTKDQWYAWWAAWLGWTLDAFDFTVFLLIMKPIADYFHEPLAAVAFVLTVTLWMRLIGQNKAVNGQFYTTGTTETTGAVPSRPGEKGFAGQSGNESRPLPVKYRWWIGKILATMPRGVNILKYRPRRSRAGSSV